MNRRHLLQILAAAPLATLPSALRAEEAWPSRPVRLLIAYAPGGGTDNVARVLAARLQAVLGQPVVVENKPGAGGNLATDQVAAAKPDGYTLLMGNQGPMTVNQSLFPNMRFDPLKTLDPVALVADAPLVAVAGPGSKAKTLKDLLEEARQQKGQLSYASASNGSASHLAAALLFQMAGIEAQHLPFRGAGPALNDVVAGHIPFMVTTLPSVVSLIQSELVRPLAVTGASRIAALPDVPTVAEAGVPGYHASAWYGILTPKGTPEAIRRRLEAAIADSLTTPDVEKRLQEEGAVPSRMGGEAFGQFMAQERTRWAKLVADAGIAVD
ncbi:Bug family tripartite tricarboxylate transporter substrate binding protein [Roseomonas marmotae]|uniref:Tripartite tricarboxylate transporter substrate binding protein n=1 Tax=Roseomonas marmotae TaxID=2768161 RepID=A0ABS3K8G2_9PROT|nr:tripartite tricarboxylate transporter substrate binding protein [Roseomonas marmotae]MBO1073292.1 tripartite tricarboxylate transporter substrate binding protein [Roseomonas marmotae]QTI79090.1 tripartite tricarboxylate transporter substrate binding protein [Roseomonas marmotae]